MVNKFAIKVCVICRCDMYVQYQMILSITQFHVLFFERRKYFYRAMLAQSAVAQSAVMRLHVVRLSVCL